MQPDFGGELSAGPWSDLIIIGRLQVLRRTV
jgi:hypothetical protein